MQYSKMNFLHRTILRIARKLFPLERSDNRVNWIKTIYLNFRTMPFSKAKHLPIYVYGKVSFINLDGEIDVKGDLRQGKIKLGVNIDLFSGRHSALINLAQGSHITFHGQCNTYVNYIFRLTQGAHLEIGDQVVLGSNLKICCTNHISIGKHSGIGFESQIIDTNFHYVLSCEDNAVKRMSAPIHIGSFNWVGNRTTIMHGTQTPAFCIVGSNSLLNKNYNTPDIADGGIIAGQPAIIRSSRKCRKIINAEAEIMLNKYFNENKESSIYKFENCDESLFSSSSLFK